VLRAGSVAVCGCTLLAAQLFPCSFPGDCTARALYCHGQMKSKHNTPLLIKPLLELCMSKKAASKLLNDTVRLACVCVLGLMRD